MTQLDGPPPAGPVGVSLLGIPWDGGSTYLRGSAEAPARIREALYSNSANLWTEDGIDLGQAGVVEDAGNLILPMEPLPASEAIERGVTRARTADRTLICLGGDHSITYPILSAHAVEFTGLTVLHFDAHPDLYRDYGGPLSHACQFSRVMESGRVRRLVQVGIRTLNGEQADQARRFDVEIITMRNWSATHRLAFDGPLYISFDLDVLDPAFAPGVSHYEPGGLSIRQALELIQALRVPVVGADIVEYNPIRDHHNQTAMAAAKILKEIAAAMLRVGQSPSEKWP